MPNPKSNPQKGRKHKIAIVGGGPSGLAAAFELSNTPELREKFEVTVYQMGWRLGGKCATGRSFYKRIEEHGIHVFLGWYVNAMTMLQQAYEERNQTEAGEGAYFKDCHDGFTPGGWNLMTWYAPAEGIWKDVAIRQPSSPGKPWNAKPPQLWNLVKGFLHSLTEMTGSMLEDHPDRYDTILEGESILTGGEGPPESALGLLGAAFLRPRTRIRRGLRAFRNSVRAEERVIFRKVLAHLHPLADRLRKFEHEILHQNPKLLDDLLAAISLAQDVVRTLVSLSDRLESHRRAYFLLTTADFGLALLKGLLKLVEIRDDQAYIETSALSDIEFRDWMTQHGLSEQTTRSPIFKFMYNGTYSYPNGDNNGIGSISARAAVLGALLSFTANIGAPTYAFNAGCAEVFVAPLYQCLKARGVKFNFFHRVAKIHHSTTGHIQKMTVHVQARIKGGKDYDPLEILKFEKHGEERSLACWPYCPDVAQLSFKSKKEETAIANGTINLESTLSEYKVRDKELVHGKDFDEVILTTPPQVLQYIAKDLMAKDDPVSRRWYNVANKIGVVQTQQVQIWLKKSAEELGVDSKSWGLPAGCPVGTNTYQLPLTCWGDYSQLLKVEPYDPKTMGEQPKFLGYFTSVIPKIWNLVESTDQDINLRLFQIVRAIAITNLQQSMRYFFKNEPDDPHPGAVNLELLIRGAKGEFTEMQEEFPYGFAEQYFRANIDPTELYTQALPGTGKYRLRPNESGYHNLFFAGDGTNNGYNFGCVEATIISGKEAAFCVMEAYNEHGVGEPVEIPSMEDSIDSMFTYYPPEPVLSATAAAGETA